jgi:hypothetical protein
MIFNTSSRGSAAAQRLVNQSDQSMTSAGTPQLPDTAPARWRWPLALSRCWFSWDGALWQVVALHLLILLPTAGALAISAGVTADQLESGAVRLGGPCMIKQATGYDCPTCGMTRAFCCISHGELRRAGRYNVLSFGVYLLFAAGAAGSATSLLGYLYLQTKRRAAAASPRSESP